MRQGNLTAVAEFARIRMNRHGSHRATRRGTMYILVMGAAAIVSLVGMTGLMVARLQYRQANQARDWQEAGDLALSAIEVGVLKINATPTWRSTFTNNAESTPVAMGDGTFTYKFVDAALGMSSGDGNLNNNTYDPVRLYGIGRVGNAVRVYSVLLVGDTPLEVLRTTVAASGYLNNAITSTAAGGPLSTNGLFTRGDVVNGNVEANTTTGAAAINGTLTAPAAAKAFPDKTVFDAYKRLATAIDWSGASGTFTLSGALLSSTPGYGGHTNANAIYSVDVPANSTLKIQFSHIKGTMVIDCQDKGKVEITQPIYWEPNSADMPILLIRHQTSSATTDKLQPAAGTVTEGGTNYNSQLNGLVHVIGATGAPSGNLIASINGSFNGTLIVDQDAKIESLASTFVWNMVTYYYPPIGYTTGATMRIKPGTLQWEAAP